MGFIFNKVGSVHTVAMAMSVLCLRTRMDGRTGVQIPSPSKHKKSFGIHLGFRQNHIRCPLVQPSLPLVLLTPARLKSWAYSIQSDRQKQRKFSRGIDPYYTYPFCVIPYSEQKPAHSPIIVLTLLLQQLHYINVFSRKGRSFMAYCNHYSMIIFDFCISCFHGRYRLWPIFAAALVS